MKILKSDGVAEGVTFMAMDMREREREKSNFYKTIHLIEITFYLFHLIFFNKKIKK